MLLLPLKAVDKLAKGAFQFHDTITTPENYFNTVLYTGNATSRSITTTFQPDFVWLKNRGPSARNHRLFDSVRGATKGLYSDLANAEYTENSLTAFNTNGLLDRFILLLVPLNTAALSNLPVA